MNKVSIIGVGRVGSTLAYSLVTNPKIDEILLLDVVKPRVDGTILDISHAYPEFSHKLKSGEYVDTDGSNIIVITAGKPRNEDTKMRMDLLNANKKIITDIINSIRISENTILIIFTNPVEPLTYLAYKLSGSDNKKVIGFSNILDSERLKFILSQKTDITPDKIQALVIGEHSEDMIPLFSYCRVDGKPLTELNVDLEEVFIELQSASKRIISLIDGTNFGPARHLITLINAIINDTNQIFPLSFYIDKEESYNIDNVCLSLPVRVNESGIKEVVRIEIDEKEREKLKILSEKLRTIEKTL